MKLFQRKRARTRRSEDSHYAYPLCRENNRTFPESFDGFVCIWDIDKTYLESDIDSLRGLLKIPFEFAIDKRTVPGADNLLRLLRRPKGIRRSNGLYFVSASPNQLRHTIERKMLLDAVEHDGITLKNWTAIVRKRTFAKLREQIGYKLSALLLGRKELAACHREILFGDDSEADALIYTVYADICAGRLRGSFLRSTLLQQGVAHEDAHYVDTLCAPLPERDCVERIFIHIEKEASVSNFDAWNPRLVACRDTFQMALMLLADDDIDASDLAAQATFLHSEHSVSPEQLRASFEDLIARKWLVPLTPSACSDFMDVLLSGSSRDELAKWTKHIRPAPRSSSDYLTPNTFLG